ncbi:MFS transporter [Nesterenkonia ebinurensis]|uniref:MFS transporter n=1 Tax=Nesterenkonia ebinurensis TaxID=2608252 RepID=UPI00123D7C1C|nr:MFS transporter [Nesterenkonia ebinurensis]
MNPVPSQHFRRLVYSLALSVGAGFGAILYGTSVLITSSAAGAEFTVSQLSLAFSGSVLAGALCSIRIGRHADRHGVRGLIGTGGVLVMLGFLGFSLSTEPWQVLAAWWLLIGPGSAMVLFEPAFVALQQWFSRSQRNRAAGTMTLITGLAGPIFIPSTSYLVEAFGWRVTAALLGVFVLGVSGLTASWALRAAPRPAAPELSSEALPPEAESGGPGVVAAAGSGGAHVADGTALSRRGLPSGFIPLTVSVALTMAVLESYNVHRVARFEAAGFSTETVAWWAAAVGLLSLPARFLLPMLANRFDSAKLWVWTTVLIMPAVWLSVRGTALWEMSGHFILFGLLFGAFIPLRAVVMSDWYSGASFGALMGIQAVAIALGRAGGPAAVGWLADTGLGYPAGMALLTGALLISLLSMLAAMHRHH